MKELLLNRLYDSNSETVGILYFKSDKLRYSYVLEDTYNKDKIPGSTRIPAGQYEIKLRREGKFFEAYRKHENKKIAELTEKYGILHLQDVPNFEFVLMHIGSTNQDTRGCLLIGNNIDNFSIENGGLLTSSTIGYAYFIQHVLSFFDIDRVRITILDTDERYKNNSMGKITGFRKYILVLIFLVVGLFVYLRSDRYDRDDKFYDYLIVLAGIGIAGSVGEHFSKKINKIE